MTEKKRGGRVQGVGAVGGGVVTHYELIVMDTLSHNWTFKGAAFFTMYFALQVEKTNETFN